MSVLAWDHNTYYHDRLLRALPRHCERVLDVGCGAGGFAARVAQLATRVDALDRSPEMIALATRAAPGNVTCMLGDLSDVSLPSEAYDAITSICALHHMPLPQVLPKLAAALRPGGTLAAIGLYRLELPRDLPAHALSSAAVYGRRTVLICIPRARRYRQEIYRREREEPVMPVMPPKLTLHQVRQQVREVLPGAHVRRLLLWRHELLWHKPGPPVT
jgi:SAM-dependent methyltransferase